MITSACAMEVSLNRSMQEAKNSKDVGMRYEYR